MRLCLFLRFEMVAWPFAMRRNGTENCPPHDNHQVSPAYDVEPIPARAVTAMHLALPERGSGMLTDTSTLMSAVTISC